MRIPLHFIIAGLLTCLVCIAAWGNASTSFAIVFAPTSTVTDPTTGVLPAYNDAYPNWSNAGLVSIGGIPSRPTPANQCGSTLTPSGGDDLSQIQTAINSCSAGKVVLLGTGTFTISAMVSNHHIFVNKGITLRGTGTCNNASSPYCGTVINISPGGSTQTYLTGGDNCGGCSGQAGPTIFVGPSDTLNGAFQNTWSGCAWSTACNGSAGTIALDADGLQGQSKIQVHTLSGFSIGMFVRIDEAAGATTYTGPLGTSIYAASDLTNSSGSPPTGKIAYATPGVQDGVAYGALYDRETSEIHEISSIGVGPCPGTSCTLTFDTPLTINFRHGSPHYAQVYQPNNPFVQQAGIENISIVGSSAGQIGGPINMTFCAYCWIKNVETKYWIGGVILNNSIRDEITGSYFHDCSDCENNGNEYPVAIDGGTTESLVDNNIIHLAGKGMVGRSCGGGNVVAYNYVDDTFYQASSIGNYWLDDGVNASHYTGAHHVLFEGNWGDNADNDNTHGNVVYQTFFRNDLTGLRTNFNDPSFTNPASSTYNPSDAPVSDASGIAYSNGQSYPSTPAERHAVGMMALDYWMAYVGNVLGTSGQTISGHGWTYQFNGQQNQVIWMLGWVDGGNPDPNLTGSAGSFFFRHGDYDYLNGSINDWQTGYSHTLPNSFYLSSQPAFFGASGANCTYPWPWVTPTGGSVLQTPTGGSCGSTDGLPAKARFDAGTPFVQP